MSRLPVTPAGIPSWGDFHACAYATLYPLLQLMQLEPYKPTLRFVAIPKHPFRDRKNLFVSAQEAPMLCAAKGGEPPYPTELLIHLLVLLKDSKI